MILAGSILLMLWQLPAIQGALGGSKEISAVVIILVGMSVYAVAALVTGAVRIRDLRQALRR